MKQQDISLQQPEDPKSNTNEIKPTSRNTRRRSATKSSKSEAAAVPSVKIERNGDGIYLLFDCEDQDKGAELLMKAIGVEDEDCLYAILRHLANASPSGVIDENDLNSMLSIVKGLKPRD